MSVSMGDIGVLLWCVCLCDVFVRFWYRQKLKRSSSLFCFLKLCVRLVLFLPRNWENSVEIQGFCRICDSTLHSCCLWLVFSSFFISLARSLSSVDLCPESTLALFIFSITCLFSTLLISALCRFLLSPVFGFNLVLFLCCCCTLRWYLRWYQF